jgi:site-specific recombinase XerD
LDFISRSGLTLNSYLEFKRYLAGRVDYSVATKAKYLSVAKVVLKELNRRGYLPTDITSTIKGFRQTKKHKRDGINDDEMSSLMQAVKELQTNPNSDRIKAILSLLTLQGLRQIEIVRLSVSDIDLVANTALILGKGRDDKEIVDLHPETSKSLAQYMKSNGIKSGALFVSQSNNSRNQRLSTRSVRELITRLLVDLAITKSVHGFRHYFTTTLIKTYKGDLLEVAGYTRHKSIETLQVYNDSIKKKSDLPRYYSAFDGIGFSG